MNPLLEITSNWPAVTLALLFSCLLNASGVAQAEETSWAQSSPTVNLTDTGHQYFDLGCRLGPWEGYFAPERWTCTPQRPDKPYGKKTKPIQGSPKATTVVFPGMPHTPVAWSREIPVSGYLSFRILPVSSHEAAMPTVSINGHRMPVVSQADGQYYSPFLRAGDLFTLHFPPGILFSWSALRFHSNYKAVIIKPAESSPLRRFAPIKKALLQRVFFPSEAMGTWPVFDQDGDPATLLDQTELRVSSDQFIVHYEDTVQCDKGNFYLERLFTIQEHCGEGSVLQVHRRWVPLPIIPK